MLSFFSKPTRTGGFCDGVSRRDFLIVGGSVMGGLSLADILRRYLRDGAPATPPDEEVLVD